MAHPLEQMHIKTTVPFFVLMLCLKKATYLDSQGLREQGQSPTTKKKKIPVGISQQNNFLCCIYFRLQNSPYFLHIQVCASSQTKGLERGWKQRARLGRDAKYNFFSLVSHALLAGKTLTPRFTDFFTDFEKKMTVLQSILFYFFQNDI